MSSKRHWKEWPGRIRAELNGTSGIASIGGAILSILSFIGLSSISGFPAKIFGWSGVGITVIATLLAIWNAIPPKLLIASHFNGKRITLADLSNIYPNLKKLGIIGISQSGKSTLIDMIRNQPPSNTRTQQLDVYISSLQTIPVEYVAFLDGDGSAYADQFKIAENADVLILVLDHNALPNESTIEPTRINDHTVFMNQLRSYLKNGRTEKIAWMHLLWNKLDLLENTEANNLQDLNLLISNVEKEWKDSNFANKVTSSRHSNRNAQDIGAFTRLIVSFITQ